ncbi:glycosyltransferase family 2 protein [Alteromonas mediterranea]|uniref:glycosyltransferase family 2 protein n=1 Tax=Alteromonas mediterranea TaxID=314275 RepID=UPI0003556DB8|nr:Glycosyl transferase 2 family protein [Alteromonas mediterranea U8]
MDEIKVSICVAYYNRSEYVKECIQSLLDQDYDSFEIIVVNDGSKDPLTATRETANKSRNLAKLITKDQQALAKDV